MSSDRLKEAKDLFDRNHFNWAFYTAGYAVEFALKAAICNTLDLDDLFDDKKKDEFSKSFKIHRLEHLIPLSGLSKRLEQESNEGGDPDLFAAHQYFTSPTVREKVPGWGGWSEQQRYNATDCPQEVCKIFLNHAEALVIWIHRQLQTR